MSLVFLKFEVRMKISPAPVEVGVGVTLAGVSGGIGLIVLTENAVASAIRRCVSNPTNQRKCLVCVECKARERGHRMLPDPVQGDRDRPVC